MPLEDSPLAALTESHRWEDRPSAETLKHLPNSPAVYLLVAVRDAPVQLGTTQQLRRLVISRLVASDDATAPRADLGEIVRAVLYRPVSSAFEGTWWYYRLARELHPREYRKLIGFGPTSFLHVNFADRLPEIRVTDQIWRSEGEYLGPFSSQRGAQQALEMLWDLFDLCRHPEQFRKSPGGSRCAYADMGRCDAPCDGAVAPEAMIGRTRSAWQLACGGADHWIDHATARMKQLAAAQQFEKAAQIKQQLASAKAWQSTIAPRVMRDADMRFLIAVPAARRAAWKFFSFCRGDVADGPLIATRKLDRELPPYLTTILTVASPAATDQVMRMEQTWLVSRLLEPAAKPSAIITRVRSDSTASSLSESVVASIHEFRCEDEPDEMDRSVSAVADAGTPPPPHSSEP